MFLLTVMPQRSRAASAALPADAQRGHVDQHQVVVGAAAHQPRTAAHQCLGQGAWALSMICLAYRSKLGPQRLAKADRLAGDDVHQRAALNAGKDVPIEILGVLRLAHRHARRADREVSCAWCVVTKSAHRHRTVVQPGRHQARVMSHVHKQLRTDVSRNLGESPCGISRG